MLAVSVRSNFSPFCFSLLSVTFFTHQSVVGEEPHSPTMSRHALTCINYIRSRRGGWISVKQPAYDRIVPLQCPLFLSTEETRYSLNGVQGYPYSKRLLLRRTVAMEQSLIEMDSCSLATGRSPFSLKLPEEPKPEGASGASFCFFFFFLFTMLTIKQWLTHTEKRRKLTKFKK